MYSNYKQDSVAFQNKYSKMGVQFFLEDNLRTITLIQLFKNVLNYI